MLNHPDDCPKNKGAKHMKSIFLFLSIAFIITGYSFGNNSVYSEIESISYDYGTRIHYEYGSYYFPPRFYEEPFSPSVTQIQNNNIKRIIDIVSYCLSQYNSGVLFDKIDAIYLADNFHIMKRDMSVFSLGRSIYIADSCDGERLSDSTIIAGLHKEIHIILYKYYPNIINDSVWASNNVNDFEYDDDKNLKLPTDSLNKMGFLNADATKSILADFASFGVYHFTKPDELNTIAENHKIIHNKHQQYIDFLKEFELPDVKFSDNFLMNINRFEDEYGVKIHYINNITNFPRLWSMKPFLVSSGQISEENALILLNVIEGFFDVIDEKIIESILSNIYLVDNMIINSEKKTCHNSINSIYISSSFLDSKDYHDKYIINLAYSFANIFRTNFYSLIPENKWIKIGKSTNNPYYEAGFLSESGKQHMNLDIQEYFVYYLFKKREA